MRSRGPVKLLAARARGLAARARGLAARLRRLRRGRQVAQVLGELVHRRAGGRAGGRAGEPGRGPSREPGREPGRAGDARLRKSSASWLIEGLFRGSTSKRDWMRSRRCRSHDNGNGWRAPAPTLPTLVIQPTGKD